MVTTVTDENRTAADGGAGARLGVAAAADPHTFFACLIPLVSRLDRARLHQDQSNSTFECLFYGVGVATPPPRSHPPSRGNNTDGDRNTIVHEQRHVSNNNVTKAERRTDVGGTTSGPRTEATRAPVEAKVGRQTLGRKTETSVDAPANS